LTEGEKMDLQSILPVISINQEKLVISDGKEHLMNYISLIAIFYNFS